MLTKTYLKVMAEINEYYPEKMFQWLSIFYKQEDKRLESLEDNINLTWESCLSGDGRLVDFIRVLNEYKKHMGVCIRLYFNRNKEKK